LVAPSGCASAPANAGADGPSFTEPSTPAEETLCNGDDPACFCDDGNPCTTDVNCTPCSTLPSSERDIDHCTPDDELPPACNGETGCVHVAQTTPPAQIDDCFPVLGASDVDGDAHAGVCRSGVCVDDPT
jgi:hypothetical protein